MNRHMEFVNHISIIELSHQGISYFLVEFFIVLSFFNNPFWYRDALTEETSPPSVQISIFLADKEHD